MSPPRSSSPPLQIVPARILHWGAALRLQHAGAAGATCPRTQCWLVESRWLLSIVGHTIFHGVQSFEWSTIAASQVSKRSRRGGKGGGACGCWKGYSICFCMHVCVWKWVYVTCICQCQMRHLPASNLSPSFSLSLFLSFSLSVLETVLVTKALKLIAYVIDNAHKTRIKSAEKDSGKENKNIKLTL